MAYQPYLQQVDKQPAIPKFANAAAEPKAEAPVSKSRRQETTNRGEGKAIAAVKAPVRRGRSPAPGRVHQDRKARAPGVHDRGKYLPPLESVTTTAAIATTATVQHCRQADCGLAAEADQAGDQKIIAKIKKMLASQCLFALSPEGSAQRLRNQDPSARDLMG